MKRAVALFLTLVFVIILIGIIGSIFSLYEKISKNNFYKTIPQNSLIIKDIKNILDKFLKDINGSDIKLIYNTFPIFTKNGEFKTIISIKPLFDKVDINTINKNQQIKKYLNNILDYYQITDPVLFINIIEDTIDSDKNERSGGSEIILQNPFFRQGKIYNYSHFKEIMDYYTKMTGDNSIYNIPWKKLIFFGEGTSVIDCNIISKDVAKFLNLTFNKNLNCESLKTYKENKKIMQNFNIIPFSKSLSSYLIKIDISFGDRNLSIIYDINKKRIINIKSYILY